MSRQNQTSFTHRTLGAALAEAAARVLSNGKVEPTVQEANRAKELIKHHKHVETSIAEKRKKPKVDAAEDAKKKDERPRGRRPNKKGKSDKAQIFKSAKTGKIVSDDFAKSHPATTYGHTVDRPAKKPAAKK